MQFATLLLVGVLAGALGWALARLRGASSPTPGGDDELFPGTESRDLPEHQQLAAAVWPVLRACAHPSDLIGHPLFEAAMTRLCSKTAFTTDTLIGFYTSDNAVLSCLALEALGRRKEASARPRILEAINEFVPNTRFFQLRALGLLTPADEPLVGEVLTSLDGSWQFPMNLRLLREFAQRRVNGGEQPQLDDGELGDLDEEGLQLLERYIDALAPDIARGLEQQLEAWRSQAIDRTYLDSVGRTWPARGAPGDTVVLSHDALEKQVAEVSSAILEERRRSVLLVGEHGVGKSAIARSVATHLQGEGWTIFEAGHGELVAGQIYVGQFEQRLKELIDRLRGRRILWLVNNFHNLALAGRHQYGPVGAIDTLLPLVETGEIVLLGETHPGAYEKLTQSTPRILTALEARRIPPLSDAATLELVDRWVEQASPSSERPILSRDTRHEAWMLAQQYLGDRAAPGNVLKLIELTRAARLMTTPDGDFAVSLDDLIATLGKLTGLPATVLDDRQGLELDRLRARFHERVMGQPEAVDCLVERVAMIKAGVTDPTRPLGVFLFAGPTGTGKTEIAKNLADYLFGSPERMIRLDMSEFQDPESLNRVLGEPSGPGNEGSSEALVHSIRKQPFSVVLLDEFEKANPRVWDVFLQVFDDGRLTDRLGNTADFRNAIIILTSNLGSLIRAGAGLGFVDDRGRFSANTVMREIERSFRKEFLNRLDRIVVFRPLGRETMREILRKELGDAFRRRGLRNRAWAVEWDESALEFLLERGFTADLGARPLKRAIEQYLLAPLSSTIVTHQYPEGDQFLFVRTEDERLVVEFVDPDADAAETDPSRAADSALLEKEASIPAGMPVPPARIALDPVGRPEEIAALRATYQELAATVDNAVWRETKQQGLEQTRRPEFWDSPERFAVLGEIEYLDRIESGLRSAGSLLERLGGKRDRYPRDLVGRLAQQLYLLNAACRGVLEQEPRDAFVLVEAWSDAGVPSRVANDFARRVGGMYRSWATSRRMQCDVMEESGGRADRPYHLLLAVSGYAAHSILAHEEGLHVLEAPEGNGRAFRRVAARVRVCPQPEQPAAGPRGLVDQAHEAFGQPSPGALAIVRRYREEPSPLVRDTARGWRTGKLGRVLEGNFDLLGESLVDA